MLDLCSTYLVSGFHIDSIPDDQPEEPRVSLFVFVSLEMSGQGRKGFWMGDGDIQILGG
jgi:hypothetical protein